MRPIKTYPDRRSEALWLPDIAHINSDIFACGPMCRTVAAAAAAWFTTDKPMAMSFFLDRTRTVYQLGWANGTTTTDNIDIGIYDTAWNRKVSTGSIGRSGTSAWQFSDVTDTVLPRGKYWLAVVMHGTTASHMQFCGPTVLSALELADVQDSATSAFPLPDPLTNMALVATAVRIPEVAIAFRATP